MELHHSDFLQNTNISFEQHLIRNFSTEIQLRQEFVLFFLLEGSMQIQLFERSISLQTHDIFFIKPGEVHSVPSTSPDIHVLAIFIHSDYLRFLCPDIMSINFEKHHIRYSKTNEIYSSICTSLGAIIINTLKKESSTQLKMLSAISSILITLLDAYGSKQLDNSDNTSYVQRQIAVLLEYLNNNYADKITLSSAAQVLGFHPQYFSAFFKKHFHTTFVEYLTQIRVAKTFPYLVHTNQSITEIALNHGFSNHKTYNTAFRKFHGMTPSAYRKKHAFPNENALLEDQNLDYFSFFRTYWQSDNSMQEKSRVMQNHMTLSLPTPPKGHTHDSLVENYAFSIGRASDILRNDIQEQIREANQDLQIHALRMRDIFSDDLFVYYEDEEKHSVINWKYIDIIFDFLLNLGIKPYPEIGFMPRKLASKKQYASWLYRPNVSMPKSFKKWSTLIISFMEHLISRYGREEVITWNFDFWATSNLRFHESYWNESQEDFFLFYRITYFSIKNVDPDIRFGSPDFSLPSGLNWYADFFDYCKEYDIIPAYISVHLYNCKDDISPSMERLARFSKAWDSVPLTHTLKDTAISNLHALYTLMKEQNLEHTDIFISNWNLSFLSRDLVRDTSFMAPFIIYTSIQSRNMSRMMCFHSLSDITEDFFIDQKPFHGGPGLIDFNGLKKASYYAFYLLHQMGTEILDAGENHLLTRSRQGLQLLLFHYVYYDSLYSMDDHSSLSYKQRYNIYESSEDLVIHSLLPMPEGTYRIKETHVNRHSGSAYDLWMEMGAPEDMSSDIIAYLKKKNYPEIFYYTRESNGNLLFDTVLPPHSVVLLEITPL